MSEETNAVKGTDELQFEDDLKRFLQALFEKMALDVTVEIQLDGEQLLVNLTGKDGGLFVEGAGATASSEPLDALGVLLNSALGQSSRQIFLDADGYRLSRHETMKSVGDTLARWVSSSGKAVQVTGMNAVDRRGIHFHLKEQAELKTESVGTGKMRKLLISPNRSRPSSESGGQRAGEKEKSSGEDAE